MEKIKVRTGNRFIKLKILNRSALRKISFRSAVYIEDHLTPLILCKTLYFVALRKFKYDGKRKRK